MVRKIRLRSTQRVRETFHRTKSFHTFQALSDIPKWNYKETRIIQITPFAEQSSVPDDANADRNIENNHEQMDKHKDGSLPDKENVQLSVDSRPYC